MNNIHSFTGIRALGIAALLAANTSPGEVRLEKTPDNGLQPSVRIGTDGGIHLIYLSGDPRNADVNYRHRPADATHWQPAIRVNSQPGSAIAIGTIRGPQTSLGRNDRVHVAWNGSRRDEAAQSSPMLYTRMRENGPGFEPERNLMTRTMHLDGGGTVAADNHGNVHVIWHASPKGGPAGEIHRGVYVASSADGGATFGSERKVSPDQSGACGCCGLVANADVQGDLWIGYRNARTALDRGWSILKSADKGATCTEVFHHPWNIGTCPMSSASVEFTQTSTVCAWESEGSIQLWLGSKEKQPITVARGKHPRTAINRHGEIIVVWTEGTGWQKGGSLAWQVFDSQGRRTPGSGRTAGVPVWSFAAPFATRAGDFIILH